MKKIIMLVCTGAIFYLMYFQIKKISGFIKRNRRGRRNYEYFFTDEEED